MPTEICSFQYAFLLLGKSGVQPTHAMLKFADLAQSEFGEYFNHITQKPADRVVGERIQMQHISSRIWLTVQFATSPPSTIVRDILASDPICEKFTIHLHKHV